MIDGKETQLGYFDAEEKVARAYDAAAARMGRPLNFASMEGGSRAVKGGRDDSLHFKGVSWHKINNKWQARIQIDGENTQLEGFEDEEEASRAHDEAAARLGRPVNFPDADSGRSAVIRLSLEPVRSPAAELSESVPPPAAKNASKHKGPTSPSAHNVPRPQNVPAPAPKRGMVTVTGESGSSSRFKGVS